jgi:hypothetical protein
MAYGDDALDTIIQQMHNGNARLAGSTTPPAWGTTPPLPAQPVPGAPPAAPGFFSDAEALQRAARIRAAGAPVAAPTVIAPNPAVAASPAVASVAPAVAAEAAPAAGLGARMLSGAGGLMRGAGRFLGPLGAVASGWQLAQMLDQPAAPTLSDLVTGKPVNTGKIDGYDLSGKPIYSKAPAAASTPAAPAEVTVPSITPTVTYAPEDTPYQQALEAALRVQGASDIQRNIDTQLGPGGTPEGANARIRGFGARPDLVNDFNAAQAVSGTGVQVLRSPTGGLTFTDGPNAFPKQYTKPDGTATTNYNESEQFISGTARAAAEKAQLAKIEGDRDLDVLKQQIAANPTRNGKTLLLQQYLGELQSRSADRTLAATAGNNQAKLGIESTKLLLDAAKTQAEIKDKRGTGALSALKLNMAVDMLGKGNVKGASALLGARADPGEHFVRDQNQLSGPNDTTIRLVGNQGTVKTVPIPLPSVTATQIAAAAQEKGISIAEATRRARANGFDTP